MPNEQYKQADDCDKCRQYELNLPVEFRQSLGIKKKTIWVSTVLLGTRRS